MERINSSDLNKQVTSDLNKFQKSSSSVVESSDSETESVFEQERVARNLINISKYAILGVSFLLGSYLGSKVYKY